jgi:prolyl oligopeptidase
MFARLKELNQDVRYYENIEGGHGGAANNRQAAYMQSLTQRALRWRIWHED